MYNLRHPKLFDWKFKFQPRHIYEFFFIEDEFRLTECKYMYFVYWLQLLQEKPAYVCFEIYELNLEYYGTIKNNIFKGWNNKEKYFCDAVRWQW